MQWGDMWLGMFLGFGLGMIFMHEAQKGRFRLPNGNGNGQ